MDPSKFFVTAVFPNRDYLSIPRAFYRRWWHRLAGKVTTEDCVGITFECYPQMVDGRPCLMTDTTGIRCLYFIPHGAFMELKYVGRSRFRFKIPLSSEVPVEHDGADVALVRDAENEHAVSYQDEEYDYPVSDDDDDDDDDGKARLGGNANY